MGIRGNNLEAIAITQSGDGGGLDKASGSKMVRRGWILVVC